MNWFRKLLGKTSKAQTPPDAEPSAERPRWLAASDSGNPFGVELLDLMSNLSLTAMTKDPDVAARAVSWRAGEQARIARASGLTELACQLRYPAAADLPEGMLYCPECMEDKWVFAWVEGEIRVARSWTGETQLIAPATLRDGALHVDRILFDADSPLATLGDPVATFDWLMRTHPHGQRVPLPVSAEGAQVLENNPLLGFSLFGRHLFCAAIGVQSPPPSNVLCSDGAVAAAIQQRDVATLERLLDEGASANAPSTLGGYRPMHLALVVKSKPLVESLLRRGTDANQRSLHGTTPLQVGISMSCELDLLDLLRAHGADLEAADDKGFRPLHEAAQADSADAVRWLTSLGAQLEARTNNGLTPLHVAAGLGSLRAARALQEAGSDLCAESPFGVPVAIADTEGKTELRDWLRSVL